MFICLISVFVNPVLAEYRKIEKSEVIYIGPDKEYDRLENIADPAHNTSYNSLSWDEFLNITESDMWVGPTPEYSGIIKYGAVGNITLIDNSSKINMSGILDRFDFYLYSSGFLKLKIFRENNTHYNYVSESRIIYGTQGYNSVECELYVADGDSWGVMLFSSSGGMYEEARICVSHSTGTCRYNATEDIIENYNKSLLVNDPNQLMARVHITSVEYNRTNDGGFIGSLIPESPFTFYNNLTGSVDRLFMGGIVKFDSSQIMSGVSELWMRAPLVYNSSSDLYSYRVKIYHLRSYGFLNISSVDVDDYTISNSSVPTLIYDFKFYLSESQRTNTSVYVSSDDRVFLHIYAPLYSDELYFIGFSVENFETDNITAYYSQCDIANDGIYLSYIQIGDYYKEFNADMGFSFLMVNGLGRGVRGYRVESRQEEYIRIGFYSYLDEYVGDGEYITFTWPFETSEGGSLDIRYRLYPINDNLTMDTILIENLSLGCKKFYMNSTDVNTGGKSYRIFYIQLTIYNPGKYNDRVGTVPIFRMFLHDTNDLWIDSYNDSGKHHSDIYSESLVIEERISLSVYHTLHKSNGSWGVYEAPTVFFNLCHKNIESTVTYSVYDLVILALEITRYISSVNSFLAIVGPYIWEFLQYTVDKASEVWSRLSEFFIGVGEWLWDNVGVYIYQAVTWLVDAFIDATVTFIQIMLFLIPIAVFIGFVTFWYKMLKGFRIWYKRGYTAFALYIETEMIKVFTIIQGSWNLLRMRRGQRRKYLAKQIKQRLRKVTEAERRLYLAEQRKVQQKYGLPMKVRSIPRSVKKPKGKVKPRKRKAYYTKVRRARRVYRIQKAKDEEFLGWRVKESEPSYSTQDRYKDRFGVSKRGERYDFPGWRWKQKGGSVNG